MRLFGFSVAQLLSLALRLGALAAKLVLTLYMGRYFSFHEMGLYGYVFGATMIAVAALGLKFEYVVSREIVGATPSAAVRLMRDQIVFYGINFVVFVPLLVGWGVIEGVAPLLLGAIFLLSLLESLASATSANMTAMGQPLLANALFFVRSGLWVLPVVGAGFADPSYRSVLFVFGCWVVGVSASLLATGWVWRRLPWAELWRCPVDWAWVRRSMRVCWPVWLGMMGLTLGSYVDRFVVEDRLGFGYVGIVTFYTSFALAVITLIQNGSLSFAFPRLVQFHREGQGAAFADETRRTALQVFTLATPLCLAIGVMVPLFGDWFGRPEIRAESLTLGLILLGIWIRCNAETFYIVLFAREQDRALWLGNLLYLVPALGGNLLLIPLCGFAGVGLSTVLAGLFLFFWRLWFVRCRPA